MFMSGGHFVDKDKLSAMAKDYIGRAIANIPVININILYLNELPKIVSNTTANELLKAVYDHDLIIEDAILIQMEINEIIKEFSIDNGDSFIIRAPKRILDSNLIKDIETLNSLAPAEAIEWMNNRGYQNADHDKRILLIKESKDLFNWG